VLGISLALLAGCQSPQADAAGPAGEARFKALEAKVGALEGKVGELEGKDKQLAEDAAGLKGQLDGLAEGAKKAADEKAVAEYQARREQGKAAATPAEEEATAATPAAARAAGNKSWIVTSGWVSNDAVALKVSKVEMLGSWDEAAPFQRVGKSFDWAKVPLSGYPGSTWEAYKKGVLRPVIVHVAIQNKTAAKLNLGFNPDYWVTLYLRGDEGTEYDSSSTGNAQWNGNGSGNAASGFTQWLAGSLPLAAETPPGGSVSGRLAFFVADWFQPAKLFVKPGYAGGRSEVVVPLKTGS
jgi:hypothetical protein